MRNRVIITAAVIMLSSYGVLADVRTEQRTQVQFGGMLGRVFNLFGGKAAREGVTSTVVVKGNRKVTTTGNTSQIIDLSEEKIYDVDLRRKTYKVTTFAQLRKEMEEAERKAQEEARRASQEEAREARETPQAAEQPQKEAEVDFDLKKTGETKPLAGFNTSRVVMTITVREKGKTLEQSGGMVLTSDMWLAPEQPALEEVTDFDRRYHEKLYGGLLSGVSADQMAAAMAMYPMMKDAVSRMSAEDTKVEGTAILTTLTFEAVKSAEQMAAEAKPSEPEARPSGVGGLLGGLAKRARKPSADEAKPRTAVMTTTVEVLKLTTSVADTDVAIPAGFKESK
jgi:hypothetical protein